MSEFKYDVFISHSKKDKEVVRDLANRLKKDGLKVTWEEEDLQSSRTLILVMSKAAVAADWVKLERQTLLFRDSTHSRRRFIPILSEDCEIPDSIDQFAYMDWREPSHETYKKLLAACRTDEAVDEAISSEGVVVKEAMVLEEHEKAVACLAVTPDGKRPNGFGLRSAAMRVVDVSELEH